MLHSKLFLFYIFQSIMEYNGGCVLAMKGKNCVSIASDLRFGVREGLSTTVTTDFFQVIMFYLLSLF